MNEHTEYEISNSDLYKLHLKNQETIVVLVYAVSDLKQELAELRALISPIKEEHDRLIKHTRNKQ